MLIVLVKAVAFGRSVKLVSAPFSSLCIQIPNFSQKVGDRVVAGNSLVSVFCGFCMPYRAIAFESDNFYHLYNRGNNRQNIFFERENYLHFLRLIRRHLISESVEILAYCLMPNHYHLLVYLKADSLSQGMKSLSLAYTKGMNARYKRVGVLFQGRFCSIQVDRTTYLMRLVRYIHLNPVKHGLVAHPEDWEFSSYQEYAGKRQGTLPNLERVRSIAGSESEHQAFLEDHSLSQQLEIRRLMLDE